MLGAQACVKYTITEEVFSAKRHVCSMFVTSSRTSTRSTEWGTSEGTAKIGLYICCMQHSRNFQFTNVRTYVTGSASASDTFVRSFVRSVGRSSVRSRTSIKIPSSSNYTAFHFYYVCMIDGRWRANRAYNERQLTYKFQLANSCVCIWHGSIGRNLSDRARHCVPRVDGVHVSVFHSVHIDGELTCCSWLGGSIFVHDNFEHFTKNIRLCAYYCLIHGNCGQKQWQKKKKKFVALVQCFYASGNTR